MPKPGLKSITISESVYDKFHDVYEKNKDKLTMKGVNSFAGYITYMLEDKMQKDKTFAKYAPKLELISIALFQFLTASSNFRDFINI